MIFYDPFWKLLDESDQSQYSLINKYHISPGQLNRLKFNLPTTTSTLDRLCEILNCEVRDIIAYKAGSDEACEDNDMPVRSKGRKVKKTLA